MKYAFSCLTTILAFALATSPLMVSEVSARPSAEKRKLKKLKKEVRLVKRQALALRSRNSQLSSEVEELRAIDPAPLSHFPIEMVTVGDPGNPAEALSGFGAVAGEFKISKFEITNAQYAVFLNAVAATDTNGLFDVDMGANQHGGILQVGTSGSYRYAVRTGMADKPVNFMTFWNACRFCNWLHNDRPTGLQDASTTEDGAYDLTDQSVITNNSAVRKQGARFYLPSEDQWFKAAYYQPAAKGGDADGYWKYPTASNVKPIMATTDEIGNINNDSSSIANHGLGASWDAGFDGAVDNGTVTTVGSGGTGSASYYGCFDMAGNVWEWNESVVNTTRRGIRGASWKLETSNDWMDAAYRYQFLAHSSVSNVGFRVATD